MPYENTVFDIFTGIDGRTTFPRGAIISGAIDYDSSIGNGNAIIGAGTLFKSEIEVGDWIFSNSILAQVREIVSDTLLYIELPVKNVTASGESPYKIKAEYCSYDVNICAGSFTAGAFTYFCKIDDTVINPVLNFLSYNTVKLNWRKGADPRSSNKNILAPIIIEVTPDVPSDQGAFLTVAATKY